MFCEVDVTICSKSYTICKFDAQITYSRLKMVSGSLELPPADLKRSQEADSREASPGFCNGSASLLSGTETLAPFIIILRPCLDFWPLKFSDWISKPHMAVMLTNRWISGAAGQLSLDVFSVLNSRRTIARQSFCRVFGPRTGSVTILFTRGNRSFAEFFADYP